MPKKTPELLITPETPEDQILNSIREKVKKYERTHKNWCTGGEYIPTGCISCGGGNRINTHTIPGYGDACDSHARPNQNGEPAVPYPWAAEGIEINRRRLDALRPKCIRCHQPIRNWYLLISQGDGHDFCTPCRNEILAEAKKALLAPRIERPGMQS